MPKANRLQPINLVDFTGGLNLRRDQFSLGPNESPDLLNVDMDPRGGFYTRKGWVRWNEDDIVGTATEIDPWEPRNAVIHTLATGAQQVFVVDTGVVYRADETAVFAPVIGITCAATPHMADFVSWGDDVYQVGGNTQPSHRIGPTGTVTTMGSTFSEVDAPTSNTVPAAAFVEAHAGYLFIANTREGSTEFPNRIRWSHPNRPDAFRSLDFLDVNAGGGRITHLLSFADHLLIFKTNSLWALYGYSDESFQLVKISGSVGTPSPTAVTRSETAVYFFSASNKGGIYAYTGNEPVYISEKLRTAMEQVLAYENVFVSWAGLRLWVSLPWRADVGATPGPESLFVFDPDVGQGAWTLYRSNTGSVAIVLDGSDINAKFPLAALWSTEVATMAVLDATNDAYDQITTKVVIGTDDGTPAYLVTGLDQEIIVDGAANVGQEFDAYYRTRWLFGDWPDRKKSWRRPTFILRRVPNDVDLLVETFRDYNETDVARVRTIKIAASGGAIWSEQGYSVPTNERGFIWDELGAATLGGMNWGAETVGAELVRGGSMGHAAAVQLRIRSSPLTPKQKWGVDGIIFKINTMRFRT